MRLLLTHGYFLGEDVKERQIMKPYVPLGILYISSYLRGKGFETEIYDSTFGSREELFRILDGGPPGAIGIYGNLMTRANVLAIAERAGAAGWLVILGGPEPSNYAEQYLQSGADLVISGEGERALEWLARCGFDRSAWRSIPGLIFNDEGGGRDDGAGIVKTGPSSLLENLDAQPWPDRDRVDIGRYLRTWREHHGAASISVITARGCPYRCNWCSHSVYGNTHRRRSPEPVVDEIEWLLEQYSPDMLWMADDVFTIHHGWLSSYAKELQRRGIQIPFECITRADRLNNAAAALLAEIGCQRIWIGSESGSQRILNAMQRGVTVEQVQNAVEMCKQNGIQTGMFLMWGYDGEDISDIEATIGHLKNCRPDIFFTTISYPIKGTSYFEKISSKLVAIGPWRETTDRDLKVRGRHSRRFYQHADELLRSEMAAQPDPAAILAARKALHMTAGEVEA